MQEVLRAFNGCTSASGSANVRLKRRNRQFAQKWSSSIASTTGKAPIFNAPKIVIWTCAALIAIHFLRMVLPENIDNEILFRGALIPELLDQGAPYWWTLLTYTFLHADIGHVLVNSAMILALGSAVARLTGPGMFMTIFLLSGLGGGVAVYALAETNSVTVGSSGALSGLIGAAAVLMYRYRDTDPRARMMGFMVAIVVVMNLLFAFSGGGGLSWQAHLGGLVAGAVYGYAVIGRTPNKPGPRPVN